MNRDVADSSTGHQGMHGHEFLEFEYGQGEAGWALGLGER